MYVAIIVLVIFMQQAERKIPIQYTSSNLRKGKNDVTYLPLKINSASVIPVIFASAVMTAPATAFSFFSQTQGLYQFFSDIFNFQKPLGLAIYAILILVFTFSIPTYKLIRRRLLRTSVNKELIFQVFAQVLKRSSIYQKY